MFNSKIHGRVYRAPADGDTDTENKMDDNKQDDKKVDRGDELVVDQAAIDAAAKAEADKAEADKVAADEAAEAAEAAEAKKAADEAAAADEKPDDADKKGATIPKARFDAANAKHREREKELLAIIDRAAKDSQTDAVRKDANTIESEVTELEATYKKQLDDGQTDKATETMRQIRLKERQIIEANVKHSSEAARASAVEEFKVELLLERLEADFPVLNPDSDDYNAEVVQEVIVLRTGFERGGLPSSQAIAKAVKYVLGAPEKKTTDKATDTDTAAVAAAAAEAKKAAAAAAAEQRRKEQLDKNIDAANKQPAKVDDVGVDSAKKGENADSKPVDKMTEEEFAALPSSTKARLRGDFVTETD